MALNHGHTSGGFITAISQLTGSLVVFLLLASCATPTEEERAERMYDQEDELILAKEEFERERKECERTGGSMVITRHSSSKLTNPDVSDYKMARCVSGHPWP